MYHLLVCDTSCTAIQRILGQLKADDLRSCAWPQLKAMAYMSLDETCSYFNESHSKREEMFLGIVRPYEESS